MPASAGRVSRSRRSPACGLPHPAENQVARSRRSPGRWSGRVAFGALVIIGLALLVVLGGCSAVARHHVQKSVPADAASPWRPPAGALPEPEPPRAKVEIPPQILENLQELTLADIVDLALRNNPQTKATWAAARAAAGRLGSEQGAYWPQLDGTANYTKSENSFSQDFKVTQTTYTPSLALTWVLLDFGQRSGRVEQARQALYQADWSHNAMIQQVILVVEQTYYQYLQAKAQRDADAEAVKEAQTNLDAAQARLQAGLATRADVLQARSNLAQAKLTLQAVEGQIQTTRGSLATAMGISPTVQYDVGLLPANVPADTVGKAVDELIEEALTHRPDLAAARAAALAARANVKTVKGEGWPTISVQGNMSRRFYNNPDVYADNYLYGVYLSWPLFTGFSHANDVLQAQSQQEQAQQQYETLRSSVELDVWSAYYDLQTASARLTTAREFLDYATESHDVALETYRSGLGTIMDLLAAQTTLQDARTQDLTARTDWFLALAELAHATGRLGEARPQPITRPPEAAQKDGKR
jgi:outer membrane protein